MHSPDRVTGLALAALVLGGRADARLSDVLGAQLDTRLAELAVEPSRETAIAQMVRTAGAPALAALPTSPRAAALLAPLASALARARASSLPVPRRGYRAPPGLSEHLRRHVGADARSSLAAAETQRARERPWPA